jgi:hypothetical protein
MKKHYETHVEDTDKLISVAGPILEYKSWYEQYRKLMEEQAQRKYGLYTPTSEGDDDDFPSIPGMIARYSASGLTNEEMSKNPVWVDKTGNGHDLQLKNFSWKGMSGIGGYVVDIDEWGTNSTAAYFERNSIKITATFKENASLGLLYHNIKLRQSCVLKVTGIPEGCDAFLDDRLGNRFYMSEDGVYEIIPSNFLAEALYFSIEKYPERWYGSKLTIEQLPLYPGFILGDGLDDFAVTEKELNFEDTYTVYTAFIPFQNNPTRNMILCGADSKKTFSMQYSSLVYVSFIAGNNYYINANFVNGLNLFACKRNGNNICIKNLLTNKVVTGTCGDWVENAGLYYLWKNATYASFAKVAIAGQTICNGYFSTDEDDEKVLDWYKKQYPWLFPDQAWTVVGKTNEGKDRATIANITGNGNDLVLSNFGFAEGSGYNEEGEYASYLVTDGVDDKIVSSVFGMGKDFTIVGDWKFIDNKKSGTGLVKASSFYIYNTMTGLDLYINSGSVTNRFDGIKSINAACSDGRVYDPNWDEILANTGNVVGSGGTLEVSSSGGRFDRIAFKNFAIYPRILSKDDCIKAYNYLQTLKAK